MLYIVEAYDKDADIHDPLWETENYNAALTKACFFTIQCERDELRRAGNEPYDWINVVDKDGNIYWSAGRALLWRWDLRQIDVWFDEEGIWTWNESWSLQEVVLRDGEERDFLFRQVAESCRDEYEVLYDGSTYELCLKAEDMRPILALVPMDF